MIMTKLVDLEYNLVQDVPPGYQYFMIQPSDHGGAKVWGVYQTFARWGWDDLRRWTLPRDTVLFSGQAGGAIRCQVGHAPRRISSYANRQQKQGYIHFNQRLDLPGRKPHLTFIQQHYPEVDEAVQKFMFWHKLAQTAS